MKKRDLLEFGSETMSHADGSLLEALTELMPRASASPQPLRERLMANVARPALRFAPFFDSLRDLFDLNDRKLAGLFERAEDPASWTTAVGAGVELLHLACGPRVAGADNGLVRLLPGVRFPRHQHLGLERVLVLQGGYRDEPSGRIYQAGDFQEMQAGSTHGYVALPERDLLLAVSVEIGVDVDGWGRLSPSSSQSSQTPAVP